VAQLEREIEPFCVIARGMELLRWLEL